MPENLPQLSNESESVQKNQSNSSWNPSSSTPSFQPVHLKTNITNTMNTIPQDQQFTIGEWHVAADSSVHTTSGTSQVHHHHNVESSGAHVQQQQELHDVQQQHVVQQQQELHVQQQHVQQQQELHEQWLLNQNWREGSSGSIL